MFLPFLLLLSAAAWSASAQQWVQHGQKLYHVGIGAGPMDWWQADSYCEGIGGYLAEPLTPGEHNFLRGQVSRLGNNNWWLGLRYAEECRCQSVGGTGQASFVAPMDVSSVRSRRNEVVRTRCPSTFRKECNAGRNRWRWSFSERDVGFAQWNGGTGEPHANSGAPEYCATMWTKAGFNWGDWGCNLMTDAGHPFRPICEKEVEVAGEEEEDYDIDYDAEKSVDVGDNDDAQEEEADPSVNNSKDKTPRADEDQFETRNDGEPCRGEGFRYRNNKNNKLDTIGGVDRWEECQRKCALDQRCTNWFWRGGRKNSGCVLLSLRAGSERKREDEGSVYGSMRAGCRREVSLDIRANVEAKGHSCAEYGVAYAAGDRIG